MDAACSAPFHPTITFIIITYDYHNRLIVISVILQVDYYLTDGHGIDEAFRKSHFIQLAERDEFVAQLFERVRPSLQTTLRTVGIRSAPSVRKSDLAALDQIIDQDAPSLRRAATKAGTLTGTTPGVVRGGAAASASSATAAGSGTAASGSDGVKR